MKNINLKDTYLKFFESKGHVIIPSAPLIPENDPSVLFNTAGMQPLVPYLLGETHPSGTRLTDFQKCVRTNDIEEVGDIALTGVGVCLPLIMIISAVSCFGQKAKDEYPAMKASGKIFGLTISKIDLSDFPKTIKVYIR